MAKTNTTRNAQPTFNAAFTKRKMEALEQAATSHERGVQRRIALGVLSLDSAVLADCARDNADTFKDILRITRIFNQHARGMVSVTDSALARLQLIRAAAAKK